MAVFRVNSQVDRLPDSGTTLHLSVRVTAAIDKIDATPLPATAADEVRPWKWHSDTGDWTPHTRTAWRVWRIDRAGVITEITAGISSIVTTPADLSPDFLTRVDKEISDIVDAAGLKDAVQWPGEAPVSQRIVLGVVESLTGMPHPIPAGLRVFTVLAIDPTGAGLTFDEKDRFIAAPVLRAANNGVYKPVKDPTPSGDEWIAELTGDTATPPTFPLGEIHMQASWAAEDLPAHPASGRLVDLSSLLVVKPDTGSTADEDWASLLATRVADAIDPAARVMAVLDETIKVETSLVDADGQPTQAAKALLDALRSDLAPDDHNASKFLRALDTLHWSVLSPRTFSAENTPAPAVATIAGQGTRDSSLWPGIMPLSLAYGDRASSSDALVAPPRQQFTAVAHSHVAALVGMPSNRPNSDTMPVDAESIEDQDAFRRWILKRWLMTLPADHDRPAFNIPRTLVGQRRILRHDQVFPPKADSMPLVDFRILRGSATAIDVPLQFALDPNASITQRIRITLSLSTAAGQATASVVVERKGTGGSISIQSGAESDTQPLSDVTGSALSFVIRFALDKTTLGIAALVIRGATATPVTLKGSEAFLGALTAFTIVGESNINSGGVALDDISVAALEKVLESLVNPTAVRRQLSAAYAGPFLSGLLAGRTTWTTPWTPTPKDSRSPIDRLRESAEALVGKRSQNGVELGVLFQTERDRVVSGLGPELVGLVSRLFDAAVLDSLERIRVAFPPEMSAASVDPTDRMTADARPLMIRIDQLQAMTTSDDVWSRLSGLGILMARTADASATPTDWRSLNLATLHTPQVQNGVRDALTKDNAVTVRRGNFPQSALVDPVSLVVSESGGVRSALIAYDNRSIVGEMASDAVLQSPPGPASPQRRLEAYGFPPRGTSTYRLPALSFGYTYHVLPYLIAHGGVLPPAIRKAGTTDNAILELNKDPNIEGIVKVDAGAAKPALRSIAYLRTRPVGAPRVARADLPGIPAGVSPLAAELPLRAAPISLMAKRPTPFFFDRDGTRGTLDMPPAAGRSIGLRLEVNSVIVEGGGPITFTLSGRVPGEDKLSRLDITVAPRERCLRLDISGTETLFRQGPEPVFAEDEPAFDNGQAIAHDPALRVDEWREISVEVSANTDGELEPPIALVFEKTGQAHVAVSKPQLPLEANPQTRVVHVLDGLGGRGEKTPTTSLTFQRPAVDFGTYERWVNPPLFEGNDVTKSRVTKAINDARGRATSSPDLRIDRTNDDPAVGGFFAEFIRIFPSRVPLASPPIRLGRTFTTLDDLLTPESPKQLGNRVDLAVQVDNAKPEGLTSDKVPTLNCRTGHVYELRVYAAVDERQDALTGKLTNDRFGRRASTIFRRILEKVGGNTVVRQLGAPLTLTFEVATTDMPTLKTPTAEGAIRVTVNRPPVIAEDLAVVRLASAMLPRPEQKDEADTYSRLRYVDRIALFSQRWSWRGRPQADAWPAEVHAPEPKTSKEAGAVTTALQPFFEAAFVDRADTDVGDILERRLTRGHVYGGRVRLSEQVVDDRVPGILEKKLDYRSGVNLWRFGLRATSRYQAMRPGNADLVQFSHLREKGPSVWYLQPVTDRPMGRTPKRPALALVLPLTEPMMTNGAVPPLMAVFHDQMFTGYHAGDSIETSVEVARHPLPQTRGAIDDCGATTLKYWQERGPDPVRTGAAANGQPVALRTDGPLGYTFDLETEAGRFGHAAMLVAPVGQTADSIGPWSMVKLRFRRLEAPEGIDERIGVVGDGVVPADKLPLELCGRRPLQKQRYRLVNSPAISRAAGGPNLADLKSATSRDLTFGNAGVFPLEHEGLVIDVANAAVGPIDLRLSLGEAAGGDFVRVAIAIAPPAATKPRRLVVMCCTNLGSAGTWEQPVGDGVVASVRLVLSARDKPETGKTYRPAGDVTVRARLANNDTVDVLGRLDENRWLSVTSLPLTSRQDVAVSTPIEVAVDGTFPVEKDNRPFIGPVRLSRFTAPTWCQFAESMSVFAATFSSGQPPTRISSSDLAAVVEGQKLRFLYENLHEPKTLSALEPLATTDASSQIEEVMYVVLTRYVTDVFDRSREQPIAIVPWAGGTTLSLDKPVWPSTSAVSLSDLTGRARFLRVLRSRPAPSAASPNATGFETTTDAQTAPTGLFEFAMLGEVGSPVDMNPRDARGITLGISMPVEWIGPASQTR